MTVIQILTVITELFQEINIESLMSMSCHLLLNLLHELANMRGSAEHIIFANECNKFSNK